MTTVQPTTQEKLRELKMKYKSNSFSLPIQGGNEHFWIIIFHSKCGVSAHNQLYFFYS